MKTNVGLPECLVETALKMLESDESGLNELKCFLFFKQNSTDKEKREWGDFGGGWEDSLLLIFFLILNFILYKMQKIGRTWVSSLSVSSNFVSIYTRGIDTD